MPQTSASHIILGGGLAGLSAGYHLQKLSGGLPDAYAIFEAEASIGGVAGSASEDGFTFDHAIHVLYTKDPYASTLIRSLLGDNFVEHRRSAWIYSCRTYTPYPYQANLFGLPDSVIEKNLEGLLEAHSSRGETCVHNFEEWILARFGSGIAKHFMLPFNRKVWATEPREMGFQWIDDRVMLPDIDEIVAGARGRPEVHYGPNAVFWYPRIGGTLALPQALESHLKPVRTSMRCTTIDATKQIVAFENGEQHSYDALISTIPLPRLISMLGEVPQAIRTRTNSLRGNRVMTLNLGIGRVGLSDKHWVYFPEEEFEFHRISFPANFSKTSVPEGTSSIMLEFSESDSRTIERSGLVERTLKQLKQIGVLREDDRILCARIIEIDPAYVIHKPDHKEAVEEIHSYLHSRGIFSCGRFGAWEYLNMDQAILSGKRAAEVALLYSKYTRAESEGVWK